MPVKKYGPTALYRFYDQADELLYVGITHDLEERWGNHRRTQPWWLEVARKEHAWLETREEAEAAEKKAHREELPRYDKTGLRTIDGMTSARHHADPRAEREISAAVRLIGKDLREGMYPEWSSMPGYDELSARYRLSLMGITAGLRRLDFMEFLLTYTCERFVVADSRTFPKADARQHGLIYVLARAHFGDNSFTRRDLALRSGCAEATVASHMSGLRRKGLATSVRHGKAAMEYAVS